MTTLFETVRKSPRQCFGIGTAVLGLLIAGLLSGFYDSRITIVACVSLTLGVVGGWCLRSFLESWRVASPGESHAKRYGISAMGLFLAMVMLAFVASLAGCSSKAPEVQSSVSFTDEELAVIHTLSPLPPLAADPTNRYADDPSAARFGQRVFYEPRLSADGSIACASCHAYAKGFGDGGTLARGLGPLTRHSVALWNVAYSDWFFWDGRVDTLWGQALEPLEEPAEHGMTRLSVAHVVHDDPVLSAEYEAIFGALPELEDKERFPPSGRPDDEDPVGAKAWANMTDDDQHAVNVVFANVGKAFAAYERKLVSRRAPFDVFVEGLVEGDADKLAAIDESAKRGLKLFVGRGNCHKCHSGPNFSDGSFHSNGIPPTDGGEPADAGRYEGIARIQQTDFGAGGRYSDAGPEERAAALEKIQTLAREKKLWGTFKTPTLRNIARSAPYMHEGQVATLKDALRHYNTLENSVLAEHHAESLLVPLGLAEDELADLEAFLNALTDEAIDPVLRVPLED